MVARKLKLHPSLQDKGYSFSRQKKIEGKEFSFNVKFCLSPTFQSNLILVTGMFTLFKFLNSVSIIFVRTINKTGNNIPSCAALVVRVLGGS